jgi:hypothetical protein
MIEMEKIQNTGGEGSILYKKLRFDVEGPKKPLRGKEIQIAFKGEELP